MNSAKIIADNSSKSEVIKKTVVELAELISRLIEYENALVKNPNDGDGYPPTASQALRRFAQSGAATVIAQIDVLICKLNAQEYVKNKVTETLDDMAKKIFDKG